MTDTTATELEIEIEDDLPQVELEPPEGLDGAAEAPKADKSAEKTAEPASEPVDGVEELRTKLADAEKRAQQAAGQQKFAEEQAAKAKAEVATGRVTEIDARIGQLQAAHAKLTGQGQIFERDYADAMRSGDYEKVAKLQREIAKNEAYIAQVEAGQSQLESQKKAAPRAAPAAPSSPVEALASRMTPRSADWIRAHPEFATDQAKFDRMSAADGYVQKVLGIPADTDAYFAQVEEVLGLKTKPAAEAPKPKSTTPVAAPANRASTTARETRPQVKLTAFDYEQIRDMKLDPKKYALNKYKAEQERAKA